MTDYIKRIQDWYKINCNGDWEHSYGLSIETLDNPGWSIKFDLKDTSLESLEFSQEFQNPNNRFDWFHIKTSEKSLNISCGPENLDKVFSIFFDKIITDYTNRDFKYELYIPLIGHHFEIWRPIYTVLISERSFKINEIPEVDYKEIKVRKIDSIDFDQDDLVNYKIEFKIGDIVETEFEEVFDGLILTAKK